jgi:dCMP deaminase
MRRPSFHGYFLSIADAVSGRANCLRGLPVGAVLVLGDRIVSTGYNGTPEGMQNCRDGGCERCAQPETHSQGRDYDLCICVHAEQNTLLSAARFGLGVQGARIYTTRQPCFTCAKELLQAKIVGVYFRDPWNPSADLAEQYDRLREAFRHGMAHLNGTDEHEITVQVEPATVLPERTRRP